MPATQQTLALPRPLVNKILAHAQKNPDIEVCGLIGSNTLEGKDYYSIKNISSNPSCRFLMDAPEQIQTMKEMRDRQQTLFAIVHSHPTTVAEPSLLDIKESTNKDVFYIIISLNTKGVLEMRAYSQNKNSMEEVELVLEDSN